MSVTDIRRSLTTALLERALARGSSPPLRNPVRPDTPAGRRAPSGSRREATQRLEPRFRLLVSSGVSLLIEISRFDRVAAHPIVSPFGKDQRIISFGEREACLSTAHVGGALQHQSRRADIAQSELHARARNQPCRRHSFLGIG